MRGSSTSEVRLEDCTVPAQNLLGKEGEAFQYAKTLLNGSRIVMGCRVSRCGFRLRC